MFAAGTTSSSRRFYVTGHHSEVTLQLATWAEDVRDRLEEVLEEPVFFRPRELVHIALRTDPDQPPHVFTAQGWEGGLLRQRLVVVNADRVNQERVLENLCWLLLDRYLLKRSLAEGRAPGIPLEAPSWLCTGVAQALYPQARLRNRQQVFAYWFEGGSLSLSDLLAREDVSVTNTLWRASAGLMFEWLQDLRPYGFVWDGVFTHLSVSTNSVTPGVLVSMVNGISDTDALQKDWELWIADGGPGRAAWGETSLQDTMALRDLLVIGPEVLSLAMKRDVRRTMQPAELVLHRDEDWVQLVSAFMTLRLRGLGIGRSAAYREVLEAFVVFFEGLNKPANLDGEEGPVYAFKPAELLGLLKDAERKLSALEPGLESQ
jgi:hypothetical protein